MKGHNYTLIDEYPLVDEHSTMRVYKHNLTGLTLYRVVKENVENFFSFMFKTPPIDSSGVFHIIEHTVLSGSKNFPFSDPFSRAVAGSSCSFLNAMTYPQFTMYPASGRVISDVKSIFKMYADAVFNPLLEKGAFLQEGLRFNIDSNQKITSIDGVVYNEVSEGYTGRLETSNRAKNSLAYSAFGLNHDSGGDVLQVPFLDYENYKACYYQYYNPQNCSLLIYGPEEADELADYLDEDFFANYTAQNRLQQNLNKYTPVQSLPLTLNEQNNSSVFEFDASDNPQASFFAVFNIDVDLADHLKVVAINALSDILLATSKHPLYKELLKLGGFKDISSLSGVEARGSRYAFVIGLDDLSYTSADDKKVLEKYNKLLQKAIHRVYSKKLKSKTILPSVKEMLTNAKDNISAKNRGIMLCETIMGKGDFYKHYLNQSPDLEKLMEIGSKEPRYFDNLFKEIFIDTKPQIFICKPSEDYAKKYQDATKKIIDDRQKKLDNILESDKKTFEDYTSSSDLTENTASYFNFAKAADLKKFVEYDNLECENFDGSNFAFRYVQDASLAYVNMGFRCKGLSDIEYEHLSMLESALQEGAKIDFYDELNYYAHSLVFSTMLSGGDGDNNDILFVISFKSEISELQKCFSLISKLLNEFKVSLKTTGILANQIASYFTESESSFAIVYSRLLSQIQLCKSAGKLDLCKGIAARNYYTNYKYNPINIYRSNKILKNLVQKIFCKNNCAIHISANKNPAREVKEFVKSLRQGGQTTNYSESNVSSADSKKPGEILKHKIVGDVYYSALSFKTKKHFTAPDLLSTTIQNTTLWNNIRIKGGAYGGFCVYDYFAGIQTIGSYRDPRGEASFEDFLQSLSITLTPEVLSTSKDQYFSTLSEIPSFSKKSFYSFSNYIKGITNDDRRTRFENAYALTLAEAQKGLEELIEDSKKSVVGRAIVGPVVE